MANHPAIRAAMRKVVDEEGRTWLMPTAESIRLAEDPIKREARLAKLREFAEKKNEERKQEKAELEAVQQRREQVKPGFQKSLF